MISRNPTNVNSIGQAGAIVEAARASVSNIDKCTVFLTRQADFAAMIELRPPSLPKVAEIERSLRPGWLAHGGREAGG
jgi:hypothetical protein